MPRLTPAEVDAFLAEPGHLVRIGSIDADGSPLVVPAWFIHREGRLVITPRERSVWLANLRRDPRVCLVVDEEPLPYRKVVARGRIDVLHEPGDDDAWRDVYRSITLRYVPEEAADAYLTSTWDEPRALLALDLATADLSTWRMPVEDEDQRGVWAARYYHTV